MRWAIIVICFVATVNAGLARSQDTADDADMELKAVRELNAGVPDASLVLRDLAVTAENASLLPRYYENIARIRKQFGSKFDIRQQPYSELKFSLDAHERTVKQFEQSIRDNVASSGLIEQDLNLIARNVQLAIDNQAPAWFQPDNDLYKTLRRVRSRLEIVKTLDGDGEQISALSAKISAAEKKVEAAAKTLEKQILENNPVPPDDYQGADRDKLLKIVSEKWKTEGTGLAIVKQGIVTSQWDRSVRWEWRNSAFHKSDTSRIQGYVLVKKDNQLAVRYSINFVIDHLDGDRLTSNWVSSPKEEQPLNAHLLLSKLK